MENIKSWKQYCVQKVVKRMRGERYGALFAHPVLEASDSVIPPAVKESYRVIITKPMDYSTIQSNLLNGVYEKPEDFHEDMLLIYDNCMKFNPPNGINNWIYDAAVTNKAKYLKLWESSSSKLTKLIAKEKSAVSSVPKGVENAPLRKEEPVTHSFVETTSAASDVSAAVTSQAGSMPPQPTPQKVKFTFRLSLIAINEYKARLLAENKQQNELDMLPPVEATTPHTEQPSGTQTEEAEQTTSPAFDVAKTATSTYYNDTVTLPEIEQEEASTVVDQDIENMPPIASRREEGILRVNWLSENECNQLFPHCSIIGLHQEKFNYNVSDVGLRCIYNELYLSDKSAKTETTKRVLVEEVQMEDYTMKQHKMISFLLGKPTQSKAASICHLQEFTDVENLSTAEEDFSLTSTIDPDSSCDSSTANTTQVDFPVGQDSACDVKIQTLHIRLTTESTITVDPKAERVLRKNGFLHVKSKNKYVRCSKELGFTSEFTGYYKADESLFMYHRAIMRHIRLFLVNCGTVDVELSKEWLPLAEIILRHGTESEVYSLFLESKKRYPRNIGFFKLPNSGKTSYSRSMDVMWRLQTVTNALPTPFLVLHVVCRQV
ncbi:hypothetical protein BgAZ_207210 [Babesia gibsoni]|uniref:Bromo domain-containing protein n=1 Tax=Babesia gibsoni TaxID=33632 RepID=A0AAD8UQP0_BABGI|nr:hypothetical protein BgAZ_207210 [Babesia gibsoni]